MSGSETAKGPAPVFRDGAPIRAAKPPIRLFLSGGGHRASIGSAGAICALVDMGNWADVTEVVSVSGGSITNAALVRGHSAFSDSVSLTAASALRYKSLSEPQFPSPSAPPSGSQTGPLSGSPLPPRMDSQSDPQTNTDLPFDPRPGLKALIDRLLEDRASLLATPTRKAIMSALAAMAIALVLAFAFALGIGPVRIPSVFVLLLGVSTPLLVVMASRLGMGWIWSDVVKALVDGKKLPLQASASSRRYMFCASGLSSGVPYYFWSQGVAPSVAWGESLQSGYTLHDAVLASTSLPGVGSVRAPVAQRNEVLVDGGVSGLFGQQREVPIERHAKDTFRGDVQRLAIDAGRHSVAEKQQLSVLTKFSILFALSRWLKASLEATYINDLGDFKDGHLVRLCRDPSMSPTAGVHGPALDRAREETSKLGLFGITKTTTIDALISGYVATRIAFQPSVSSVDLVAGLRQTGVALGLDDSLAVRWQELSLGVL